ncbi:NUDIX domain-containing protein [Muricoccus radiodurans]|uniref:NUDIX domain-containing protein n=1 Tax=Muricoccus radiodurans TaxID=2231721 RepID=UPI003CE9B863
MSTRPTKLRPIPAHPLYVPESEETVWDGRFPVQRVRFRYRKRDGSLSGTLTWELWRRGQGVIILPWDPVTDRVALIEQFRLPALAAGEEPLMTECPAGLLEPDENPVECARRELTEETGLTAGRVAKIGTFMTIQGGADERIHCHVVEVSLDGVTGSSNGLVSENEETTVVVMDAAEAFAMANDNRLRNAPAVISLLWLQVNQARLRAEWS